MENVNDALGELSEALNEMYAYAIPEGIKERARNALDNLETAINES